MPTSKEPPGQHVWMYYARGIAMLLVVLHNVGSTLDEMGIGAAAAMTPIENFFAPFRMPLLMFLSGMLLSRSLKKPPRRYFRGKLANIGWPYLVWSVIFLTVSQQISFISLIQILYNSPTYLWYLWFLLAYYIGLWVIIRCRIPMVAILGLSIIFAFVMPDFMRASRFFYLLTFFVAGDMVSRNMEFVVNLVSRIPVIVLALFTAICTGALSVYGVEVRYDAVYIIGVASAILILIIALPRLKVTPRKQWLAFIGKNSLIIYVTHRPVMWITVHFLYNLTQKYEHIYPVTFAAAFGAGILSAVVSGKSRVLKAFFVWPSSEVEKLRHSRLGQSRK